MRALAKRGESSRVLKELYQNSSMLEDKLGDQHSNGGHGNGGQWHLQIMGLGRVLRIK